jgi:HK97 family phage major capsid protein
MDTELKGALDAHGAAIDAAMKKYDGQIADAGKADNEIRAEVKALSDKFESTVTEIGQKMAIAGEQSERPVTAGAEFVKSAQFKALAAGQLNSARIEVKNTVVTQPGAPYNLQRPGITPGAFGPLTIRQLLNTITVTGNAVPSLRELAWTNNAAETAEGAVKPESILTFEPYDVVIQTVAHFIKVSNQLLADAPAVVSYIDTRLRDGLAQRIERQIVIGNGTSPNLSGLNDAGNFVAFTPLSGANLIESINRGKWALWTSGYVPDTVIVNPADWAVMEVLREGVGTGAYLYGAPGMVGSMSPFGLNLVISNWMPAGQFWIGSLATAVTLFQRSGAVVEMGFVNDDFTRNLVTIRAEERLGLGVDIPAATRYGPITTA